MTTNEIKALSELIPVIDDEGGTTQMSIRDFLSDKLRELTISYLSIRYDETPPTPEIESDHISRVVSEIKDTLKIPDWEPIEEDEFDY